MKQKNKKKLKKKKKKDSVKEMLTEKRNVRTLKDNDQNDIKDPPIEDTEC